MDGKISIEKTGLTLNEQGLEAVKSFLGNMKGRYCEGCVVVEWLPCDKNIPCCRCGEKNCNGRQPCPKRKRSLEERQTNLFEPSIDNEV